MNKAYVITYCKILNTSAVAACRVQLEAPVADTPKHAIDILTSPIQTQVPECLTLVNVWNHHWIRKH